MANKKRKKTNDIYNHNNKSKKHNKSKSNNKNNNTQSKNKNEINEKLKQVLLEKLIEKLK
ncbi:MAG: hypothetical protein IJH55_03745 [Romboutsia sp.]|nr:hypothetical protein [Romboutsia sp.]